MAGLGRSRERNLLGLAGDDVHCASEISTLDSGEHRRKATRPSRHVSKRDTPNGGTTPRTPNLGFRPETSTNLREGEGGVDVFSDAFKEGNGTHAIAAGPKTGMTFVRRPPPTTFRIGLAIFVLHALPARRRA